MRKSTLLWFLSLLLLLSLASASVFAEEVDDTATPETTSEDSESEDADEADTTDSDEEELAEAAPVADYIVYPCIDGDGNVVESPLVEEDEADSEEDEADAVEEAQLQLIFGLSEDDDEAADEADEAADEEDEEFPICEPVHPEPAEPVGPPPPPINPWYGIYWNNPTFNGKPALSRADDYVAFNWGGESPYTLTMGADYNSVRWTHTERVQPTGFYRVRIASDYGARLDINGARIVDTIRYGNASPFDTYYWVRGGLNANFRFDYFHHTGAAVAAISVEQVAEWAAPFGYGNISGNPVLRDGPGTEYFSNGRLVEGQRVKLTGHRNLPGNWVGVITDEGEAGWVNTFHLLTNFPVDRMQTWPFTPDGVTAGEPRGRVSADNPYINVRYQPKSDSNVLAQAPQGMYLALVGRTTSNNYLLVRMWEGTLGWAPRGGIDTNININSLPIRYDDTVVTSTE